MNSTDAILIYLVGVISGYLLLLRGTICLHASAVIIAHQAVVLVGHSGAGKSTTAATLAQRGYPVLADDIVALVEQEGRFFAQPGYPRLRLWETSVTALYGDPNALPRLLPNNPYWHKQYLDLTQPGYQFQSEAVPIAAVYVIMGRQDLPNAPCIVPLPQQQQLLELVARSYTTKLISAAQRGQEFQVLGRLSQQVPVRQLIPHRDPARLPQLVDTMLTDIYQLALAKV